MKNVCAGRGFRRVNRRFENCIRFTERNRTERGHAFEIFRRSAQMNPQFRPLRSLALETERKLQTLRKTADAALKTVCGDRPVFLRSAEVEKLRHRVPINLERRIKIARNQRCSIGQTEHREKRYHGSGVRSWQSEAEIGKRHELRADIHLHIVLARNAVVPEKHVLRQPVSCGKNVMRARCAAVSAEDRGTGKVFHIILRLRRQRDGRVFPRGETKRHRKTVHAVALRLNVRGVLIPYSRVERLVASDFSIRADSGFEKEFKLFPCGGIAVCGQPARLRELPEKDFLTSASPRRERPHLANSPRESIRGSADSQKSCRMEKICSWCGEFQLKISS